MIALCNNVIITCKMRMMNAGDVMDIRFRLARYAAFFHHPVPDPHKMLNSTGYFTYFLYIDAVVGLFV